ncbi:hypothetical protein EJ06DRAFT_529798 [Trichodelitschia bisporula]|uniref:5'-3' DNA helicase ZGRF1-like N-terminal domain-containing protein n=1 Tax=Trichodelitschia bisporula TaxID=703511 RepID=A0A6G1HXC9_9PEZI|nr:hypothetical protein EJ06DRAFT_529798 [Trichodelitschia bisporula]
MTATPRGAVSTHIPLTQNTAEVLEFRCLYTHDLRRKQKRWQDGLLRYHTFNKRIMVYDDERHLVGDAHWKRPAPIATDEELTLDAGVLVTVSERVGQEITDLTPLFERRTSNAANRDAGRTLTPRPLSRAPPSKHVSLSTLLGGPKGIGKAALPTRSPYDARHADASDGPQAKRRRLDSLPSSPAYTLRPQPAVPGCSSAELVVDLVSSGGAPPTSPIRAAPVPRIKTPAARPFAPPARPLEPAARPTEPAARPLESVARPTIPARERTGIPGPAHPVGPVSDFAATRPANSRAGLAVPAPAPARPAYAPPDVTITRAKTLPNPPAPKPTRTPHCEPETGPELELEPAQSPPAPLPAQPRSRARKSTAQQTAPSVIELESEPEPPAPPVPKPRGRPRKTPAQHTAPSAAAAKLATAAAKRKAAQITKPPSEPPKPPPPPSTRNPRARPLRLMSGGRPTLLCAQPPASRTKPAAPRSAPTEYVDLDFDLDSPSPPRARTARGGVGKGKEQGRVQGREQEAGKAGTPPPAGTGSTSYGTPRASDFPPSTTVPVCKLPLAGAWTVEATDLFEWRPPDWERRVAREVESDG